MLHTRTLWYGPILDKDESSHEFSMIPKYPINSKILFWQPSTQISCISTSFTTYFLLILQCTDWRTGQTKVLIWHISTPICETWWEHFKEWIKIHGVVSSSNRSAGRIKMLACFANSLSILRINVWEIVKSQEFFTKVFTHPSHGSARRDCLGTFLLLQTPYYNIFL